MGWVSRYLSITPMQLYTLLVLAGRTLYANGIIQQISFESGGMVIPSRSAMKFTLARLEERGYIEVEEETQGFPKPIQAGRYYRLTQSGRRRLKRELDLMQRAITAGRIGLNDGKVVW
jgi:DNA-binding PadR family transcriptional regulator